MKKVSLIISVVATCLAFTVTAAHGGTIATWTFETSIPITAGPHNPEVGAGAATSVHAAPLVFSSPSGNGSAQSYSSNSWTVGDYYQFQVSTLGQGAITLGWHQTRSASGPGFVDPASNNFKLQYSTDGTNFTDYVNYLVPVVTWNNSTTLGTVYSQDLSSVAALDNQPNVYFRLTSILGDQPTSTQGTSRVDNVLVVAAIPEPASILLVVAATTLAMFFRKRA